MSSQSYMKEQLTLHQLDFQINACIVHGLLQLLVALCHLVGG